MSSVPIMPSSQYIECDGNGFCLEQTENTFIYIRNKVCNFNCTPEKCPNFEICGTVSPKCYMLCNFNVYINCAVVFGGILQNKHIENKEECCICLEEFNNFIKLEQCTHYLCTNCFRKHNKWNKIKENEIKVIENYNKDKDSNIINKEDEYEEKYDEEEDGNDKIKCPMCRRENISKWSK